ncbi:heme peroxidase [Xylariales sp. PMI_506]|nr:heme peroxidase [Xylariales sp. PMI_506]
MSIKKNGDAFNGVPTPEGTIHQFITDIESQLHRIPEDLDAIKQLASTLLTQGLTDDREYLLENTIKWAASYGKGSPAAGILTDAMLANLWDNLKHPPLSYMGDKWRYRTADGSHNNILYPDLGKAGSYYARSVVPTRSPPAALPDPGDIFDSLFARRGIGKEHPAKFSSLAISLATIIIHDIFRTDDINPNKVASSSYLDLGPLYGHNAEMQKTVRTFKDGMLKPDTFAEPRILGQPPGVGALLVTFGRFHNYVVGQLAEINEGGRFTLRTPLEAARGMSEETAAAKRDNDLFQTGRLITCGLYVNIILHDYVRVILNLNRSNTTWTLDPRVDAFDPFDPEGTPKGIGNQVSIEFNLIYRWHATVSTKNEKWMNDFFSQVFPGKDPAALTEDELVSGFAAWAHRLDADPGKWTFGGMDRNSAGGFDDSALVSILTSTTEDVAGAFGARNVPIALRSIEILGINQGRNWGTASLNEVRKFFKLKPHTTFRDINPDPEVAASLEALYSDPDNVELYPGLVCEDTKPPMVPGSGLCAGLTVAKAILSDAVALVRGDRYYTVDSSPANLTSFGFTEIASDADVGFGTTIHKLFQRAYPGWYRSNSVYALFPLTVPPENRAILKAKGLEADYNYDPPRFIPPPTSVRTWKGVVDVLKDQNSFKVPWGPHLYELIHHDWMLSGDKPWDTAQKSLCMHALYDPTTGLDQIRNFYNTVTTELIRKKSVKMRDYYQIDAIRDVGNTSHAIAVAHLFRIPLKEQGGSLTATELYEVMATIFRYTFIDIDTGTTLAVKSAAKSATAALAAAVTESCKAVKNGQDHWLTSIFTGPGMDPDLPDYGTKLIQRLFDTGKSLDEVVWTIVPTSTVAVPIQSQGVANLLDFYLSPDNATHWAEIQKLAQSNSAESLDKLRKYALEAFRLSSPSAGVLRAVSADGATVHDGEDESTLRPPVGSTIFLDFVAAGRDPAVFRDPLEVKLDRADDLYIHHGYGGHACLGRRIVEGAMAVQLRAFARLKNLRRAPGPAGQLKSKVVNGAFKVYMDEDWGRWTPFPSNLKLHYDA